MQNTKRTLFLITIAGALTVQLLASCNGSANLVSPSSSNTKLVIINTSPDAGPLTAFINNLQMGSTSNTTSRTYFRYTTTPLYYSIGAGFLTLQLRTDHNIPLTSDTVTTASNKGYSLFLTGINAVDSLSTVLIKDNDTIPPLGFGKVRFVNVSPRAPNLDVYANNTSAFTRIPYKGASGFVQLPAGIYDFKLNATGSPGNGLTVLTRVTIQDGKIYTLYTKGMIGRVDSAAISLNIITNR